MKIFKYTSIDSAIRILQNEQVILNNPAVFNDPNDCSFIQDAKDKKRIERLLDNYSAYKVINNLIDSNKIGLSNRTTILFNFLKKEIALFKLLLKKNPYFEGVPGLGIFYGAIKKESKEISELLEISKKGFQNTIDVLVDNIKGKALVSCFSKRNDSILMWSHYADSHRGVCMEYQKPNSDFFKDVKYSNKKPSIKLYHVVSHVIALDILNENSVSNENKPHLKHLLSPFFIKSKEWSYEKEVRCLYPKDSLGENIMYDGKHYFLNLGRPKAIYVGCKASGNELNHLYNLAKNRGIPIYFMKESICDFQLIIDKERDFKPINKEKKKEVTLLRLMNEIQVALKDKAYLAAFTTALIIPGICSKVENTDVSDCKQRYIQWCNDCLPCSQRCKSNTSLSYLSGEVIRNLKEKLFCDGSVKVYGNYENFALKKITLRIEELKPWNLYCDLLGEGNITINITRFCTDMVYQGMRCYENYKNEIVSQSQIDIEDYDEKLEQMQESSILTERINKFLKGC